MRLRILWSDWRDPEPARFDLQDVVEFCRTLPAGWSMRILNATGRVGGSLPDGPRKDVAEIELRLPDEASLAAFRGRFPDAAASILDDWSEDPVPARSDGG